MKKGKLHVAGGSLRTLALWGAGAVAITGCQSDDTTIIVGDTTGPGVAMTTTTAEPTTGAPEPDDDSMGVIPDLPADTDGDPLGCVADGSCDVIDLLFVIDNSGTMGEEQLDLAANFQYLVDQLQGLEDGNGNPVHPDVNIMVTTTDFGHPLCTPFQKPDYLPRKGAPVYAGCNSRIQRFTSLYGDVSLEEACTTHCPADIAPGDQFINFNVGGSNVPDDDVAAALSCIGPQGIDGCGFESPLETMLQALNESACWNDPSQTKCDDEPEWQNTTRGFLRPDSILAIAIITDELDCSVRAPSGYGFFTDIETPVYWNVDPELGVPRATSAVCFNAGVTCQDDNGDGIYEGCEAVDGEVLHPTKRYIDYLDYLTQSQDREVVMLGIFGVPPVVAHDAEPPYEPIEGGVDDLVYRSWLDYPYPGGDIPPGEWDQGTRADNKIAEFGALAPGCTATDEAGALTGQALPPVRLREVCESLNYTEIDETTGERKEVVRCCMESICSDDFSPAIRCLTGVLSEVIVSTG